MEMKQIQNSIEKLVDDVVHKIAVNKSTRLEDPSRFDKEGLEPFMKEFWSESFKTTVADVVYTEVMGQVGRTTKSVPEETQEESVNQGDTEMIDINSTVEKYLADAISKYHRMGGVDNLVRAAADVNKKIAAEYPEIDPEDIADAIQAYVSKKLKSKEARESADPFVVAAAKYIKEQAE